MENFRLLKLKTEDKELQQKQKKKKKFAILGLGVVCLFVFFFGWLVVVFFNEALAIPGENQRMQCYTRICLFYGWEPVYGIGYLHLILHHLSAQQFK